MAYGAKQQIPTAADAAGKNTNSIMAGWIDRGPWFYYDLLTAPAGAAMQSSYNLFATPIGQPNPLAGGVPKTKLQTNMVRGNQFPPPRCLLLFQIGFYFSSTMLKGDMDAIFDGCYVEFRIDEKIFHEGQLYQYPAGSGMMGVTMTSGLSVFTNGFPAPQAGRRYNEWSKYIAPEQQFSMTIIFPGVPPTPASLGPGVSIMAFLDGLTDRSVQ
jgi:hypothetical protein